MRNSATCVVVGWIAFIALLSIFGLLGWTQSSEKFILSKLTNSVCSWDASSRSWRPVFETKNSANMCFVYPAELGGATCPTQVPASMPTVTSVCSIFDQDATEVVPTAKCILSNSADNICGAVPYLTSPSPPPQQQSCTTYELGPPNVRSWNLATFADSTAKWIWNSEGANDGGVEKGCVTFGTVYNNVQAQTNVTFHVVVDDCCIVYLNGSSVLSIGNYSWKRGADYPRVSVTLKAGNNDIVIPVFNNNVTAGMLFSAISATDSTTTVLFNSDKTWTSTCTSPNCNPYFDSFPPNAQ